MEDTRGAPGRLLAALATVYVVWGSTYVAIKEAVATLPPLLMCGVRFLAAGALLYGWCAWRRRRRPHPEWRRPRGVDWRASAILGLLLPAAGTGGVSWAEQRLPSGTAALLLATIPVWVILASALVEKQRLRVVTGIGLLLGLAGVALCLVGAATGEISVVHPDAVSTKSLLALAYLVVCGSLVAYSAYAWLARHASARLVGTYAFVNPIVAVLLGFAILHEVLTARTLLATAVIGVGVAVIVARRDASEDGRQLSAHQQGRKRNPTDWPGPAKVRPRLS
jgi:drug/metabolite transporter (DMT)-like permease